jgi:uncharacterized SAM-binding protein YcdF (DUF218 family)
MVGDVDFDAEQIAAITAFVDIDAPPSEPTAYLIFGTNQPTPATVVADRFHQGMAPLIIATGGVNRHTGIVEGREFLRMLTELGVPAQVIRYEDRSENTWQNVELAMPFLEEATRAGLRITAVSKWYHRRAVQILRTLLPNVDRFFAEGWEPVYSGRVVTRTDWPLIPDGRRRVVREWQEVSRRVADGSFRPASRVAGAWQ